MSELKEKQAGALLNVGDVLTRFYRERKQCNYKIVRVTKTQAIAEMEGTQSRLKFPRIYPAYGFAPIGKQEKWSMLEYKAYEVTGE